MASAESREERLYLPRSVSSVVSSGEGFRATSSISVRAVLPCLGGSPGLLLNPFPEAEGKRLTLGRYCWSVLPASSLYLWSPLLSALELASKSASPSISHSLPSLPLLIPQTHRPRAFLLCGERREILFLSHLTTFSKRESHSRMWGTSVAQFAPS